MRCPSPRTLQLGTIVVTCIGLLCACGLPIGNHPPPAPPDRPLLTVSPTRLDFLAETGSASPPQTITVGNLTAAAQQPRWELTDKRNFKVDPGDCHGPLPPRSTCTLSIVFRPTKPGRIVSMIWLDTNPHSLMRFVRLSGSQPQPATTP